MQIDRKLIAATNEEIEAAFEKLGIGLCVDDEYGCDVTFGPADEIEAFRQARKNWTIPGRVETDTDGVLHISGAQAVRGQRRRDVALVKFGDYCAIYGMDM